MTITLSKDISISSRKIEKIAGDPEATAKAVNLVYVNDRQEGIARVRAGKKFRYSFREKPVRDKVQLDRIKSLVLPPAWENVWICVHENGHLQATGIDALKRKQYRYHPLWNTLRNHTKFSRLLDFGKSLPPIRKQIKKDLARPGLPREKVLATVIALMESTSIRIGNESYEKLYGSIGLTTMKNKHVEVKGGKMKFSFVGKKGKEHGISIRSKKLASIVKQCRDIPGKELFQYYDEEGQKQSIDSGMVNEYIRSISQGDFTAKDFRTWAGTVQSLVAFREAGPFESEAESKRKIVEVLDKVALHLGNTRTVCKKYYVHPAIVEMYSNQKLDPYLKALNGTTHKQTGIGLTHEEKILLRILKKI